MPELREKRRANLYFKELLKDLNIPSAYKKYEIRGKYY
jgi:hypothetical protein